MTIGRNLSPTCTEHVQHGSSCYGAATDAFSHLHPRPPTTCTLSGYVGEAILHIAASPSERKGSRQEALPVPAEVPGVYTHLLGLCRGRCTSPLVCPRPQWAASGPLHAVSTAVKNRPARNGGVCCVCSGVDLSLPSASLGSPTGAFAAPASLHWPLQHRRGGTLEGQKVANGEAHRKEVGVIS